jgi:hypothetical protein
VFSQASRFAALVSSDEDDGVGSGEEVVEEIPLNEGQQQQPVEIC